nr:hypothetical protein [uncultured Rhodopila sp.]
MKSMLIAATLLSGLAVTGPLSAASAPAALNIPPSEALKHERVLESLQQIAGRSSATGSAARQVIVVLNRYIAFENEAILPQLTLLPTLASGTARPDMMWAIAGSDRLREEHEAVQGMHRDIIATVLDLRAAAIEEDDAATLQLTEDLAAADLAAVEVTEPAAEMVGELVRNKLPPT